jgi:hypothetical protein
LGLDFAVDSCFSGKHIYGNWREIPEDISNNTLGKAASTGLVDLVGEFIFINILNFS